MAQPPKGCFFACRSRTAICTSCVSRASRSSRGSSPRTSSRRRRRRCGFTIPDPRSTSPTRRPTRSSRASQFDGERLAPWQSWDLNRLAFHPDLVDLAERFLGSADLHLYDALLWAKYGGAVDYEQVHHRDFVNHSLVVPEPHATPGGR